MIQNLPAVKDECGLGHGGVDAGVVQAHKLVPLSAHHHRVRCKKIFYVATKIFYVATKIFYVATKISENNCGHLR